MPKLRHYDDLGTARFVTFCCYRLGEYLSDSRALELLIKCINEGRTKHGFQLLGYVIMPEHVHLVLLPPDGMKLGLVIREIKSRMAREYFALTVVGQEPWLLPNRIEAGSPPIVRRRRTAGGAEIPEPGKKK